MKYSKEFCQSIVSNGYQFVCWESDDNSYHFQKQVGNPSYLQLRMNEWDIDNGNYQFLFDNDMESTVTPKSLKEELKEFKLDIEECIKDDLLSKEELETAYSELADIQKMFDTATKYQGVIS